MCDVTKIIKCRKSHDDEIKYVVCLEGIYCVAKKIHFAVGHCGRDTIIKEANTKYANFRNRHWNYSKNNVKNVS